MPAKDDFDAETPAEVLVPSTDLSADIAALEAAGFTLAVIFPADDPRTAKMTGHRLTLEISTQNHAGVPALRIPGLEAPVRTSAGVDLLGPPPDPQRPDLRSQYVFTTGGDWGVGRASMQYRDLLPDRHGGRVIASHIRIAEPGPVPDYVHHHDIAFQMIYCRRGRVEVVYEDQGEPFWMTEGDFVLQPPHIRHRVLNSDDGCEVVEIAAPAEHPTFIDHQLTLPTAKVDRDRDFGGQRFCFNRATDLPWKPLATGWEEQVNGFSQATNALANVRVIRPAASAEPLPGTSGGDLCLLFVLAGAARVTCSGGQQRVGIDDSIAVAAGDGWSIDEPTNDFSCLHIELGDTS